MVLEMPYILEKGCNSHIFEIQIRFPEMEIIYQNHRLMQRRYFEIRTEVIDYFGKYSITLTKVLDYHKPVIDSFISGQYMMLQI